MGSFWGHKMAEVDRVADAIPSDKAVVKTPHQQPGEDLYTLLLIGDHGVGKSQLLLQFTVDTSSLISNIGIDVISRRVELDGKSIKLQIWDTTGQERFRTITTCYLRVARGIMVIYDVTDRESFDNLKHWFRDIDQHSSEDVAKILVGNRCDETAKKVVEYTTAKAYADLLGIPFLEVSSKSNTDVERAFMTLVAEVKTRSDS